jgi:hypothetical protein
MMHVEYCFETEGGCHVLDLLVLPGVESISDGVRFLSLTPGYANVHFHERQLQCLYPIHDAQKTKSRFYFRKKL